MRSSNCWNSLWGCKSGGRMTIHNKLRIEAPAEQMFKTIDKIDDLIFLLSDSGYEFKGIKLDHKLGSAVIKMLRNKGIEVL